MTTQLFWHVRLSLIVLALTGFSGVTSAEDHWLVLEGGDVTVKVGKNLALTVHEGAGEPVWTTMESSAPAVTMQRAGSEETKLIFLGKAADRKLEDFDDGTHRGKRIRLANLPDVNVEVELVLALSPSGELLVEVEHKPDKGTSLVLDWEASLGKLAYRRRVLIRFARDLDYVGMAKTYRRHVAERGKLAGDVTADFDLDKGLYRVKGVPGFSGDWEKPPGISRTYQK